MVGIVIVSHSLTLAQGVRELAVEMTADKVKIEIAAGTQNIDAPIGTDPMAITQAMEKAYDTDGVVVLMDLGSAIMNAEIAVEFLEEQMQSKIYLCSAPLVEGTIAAAVQAMVGGSAQDVIREAKGAIKGKEKQIGDGEKKQSQNQRETQQEETKNCISFQIVVPNKNGLHARPASKMVAMLSQTDAQVEVSVDGEDWVQAKSINSLALLGAKKGDTLHFKASGNEREKAKEKMIAFAKDNFQDDDSKDKTQEKTTTITESKKIPVSGGIGIGKATWIRQKQVEISSEKTQDKEKEVEDFLKAIGLSIEKIEQDKEKNKGKVADREMEIFDAHVSMLQDPEVREKVCQRIEKEESSWQRAWDTTCRELIERYQKSQNSYTRERALDIEDIRERVLRGTQKQPQEMDMDFREDVIVVATDIQPWQMMAMDTKYVKGIVLEKGNQNSHTSILARSMAIPAIAGLAEEIKEIEPGVEILINGDTAEIIKDKNSQRWIELERGKIQKQEYEKKIKELSKKEAYTKSGKKIEVMANISGAKDATLAFENGADAVGLFRTELLFMEKDKEPTIEEQVSQYTDIAKRLHGKTLTIRTLDVGGDKPLPYASKMQEENPFLGVRGVRYTMENKELFKRQLKAILIASEKCPNIQVMFPMISTIEEYQSAMQIVECCREELKAQGQEFNRQMKFGIMVEVPSVVMMAEEFAQKVDFFSIGTNDLSQYIMAMDRTNAKVKDMVRMGDKAVIKAIETVVKAGKKAKIPVCLCGEMAAEQSLTEKLLEVGIEKLSVNSVLVPQIKQRVRQCN